MTEIIWIFVWLLTAYLVGQVAYAKGRKDKWVELSRDYICIHKTCSVRQNEKKPKKFRAQIKKNLDNRSKKKYNKKSYNATK